MRKTPASELGLSTPRVLLGALFCCVAALLATLSYAADPAGGTITPGTTAALTWVGTAPGVPPSAAAECEEGANCDSFKLTISGTPADWTGKQVKVRIQWLSPSSDYDLEIHKDSIDGTLVASSGAGATTSEEVVLNPANASIGTGVFYIRAAYFSATEADQYNGLAEVIPAVGGPVPATQASGVAPRYQNHTPPAAGPATLGIDAAEPSIGVNWLSEGILPGAGDDKNGGRSMYIALLQTLRITFDDSCISSPGALWEDVSFVTTSAQTFDPILYTDRMTGRTLVSQLEFPAGSAATASAYTENDGESWVQSTGAGPGSGVDHQSIGGGGPFHAPLINLTYPNAVYYCAQLPTATCALSLDGGMTYGPAVPVDPNGECGGLHGHIKVGPDGTAYLPNKGCGNGQGVIVSEDNGITWDVREVPGSTSSGSDAAIGIGRADKVAGRGRIYLGYADGDTKAAIASSTDGGLTWSKAVDVGAVFGINNVAFPAVVAGDDDRAAFAFYGTPTAGGLQDPKFKGVWHLYVAHTYDAGKTWHTVDATPNDPMQRGCIWLGGGANICRNMLDFMGIDVDKRGRVLVGYNDGCAGAECAQAPADSVGNSYTALAAIARQTGGKSLFAAHDGMFPDAPTTPGAPQLTVLRNGGIAKVKWSQSNTGGSPVTKYTISRAKGNGALAEIATVPGSQFRYEDETAADTSATYHYSVTATNAQGDSCNNNKVIARFVGDSFSPAGYQIYQDPTGANETGGQAANPDLDIETFSMAEPQSGPHAGKLVFKLKVVDLSSAPNNRMWRIIWDSPNATDRTQKPAKNVGQFYVGKTKDAAGEVTYEYGTVETGVIGLVLGRPRTRRAGAADDGSFTPEGLITIVVSKKKIGAPGQGDLLGNFAVRTFAVDSEEIRTSAATDQATNAAANDFTANAATYQLIGADPAAQLVNISTRLRVQPKDNAMIAGFIVSGSEPKKVIIRGLGPSLKQFPGRLENPTLELYNAAGTLITGNDNWKENQKAAIEASGIPPKNDLEAAIVRSLQPGNYTAILRGKGGDSGIGLVEVYDISPGSASQLVNISTRGLVEGGDNVMIGGFLVRPENRGPLRVIVRALGPSLSASGIDNPLADPTLTLVDSNGTVLQRNDNWQTDQKQAIIGTGIPPTKAAESALVATLPPGDYTAIVRGKGATGTALVEVYALP